MCIRDSLESVKHRKRRNSSESSKNVKSGTGSTTRSSKARAARAARASTQQASSIAWGPSAIIGDACASLLCFPLLWRVLLCVALWSWFVFVVLVSALVVFSCLVLRLRACFVFLAVPWVTLCGLVALVSFLVSAPVVSSSMSFFWGPCSRAARARRPLRDGSVSLTFFRF